MHLKMKMSSNLVSPAIYSKEMTATEASLPKPQTLLLWQVPQL
ncbi:unnamed protein product [Brassica oleracea]